MVNQLQQKKVGATPGKLILIGVLAVVLLAVLYIQFGGSGAPTGPAARKPKSARPAATRRVAVRRGDGRVEEARTETGGPQQSVDKAIWAPPELDAVAAYDPFALPYRFPQPYSSDTGAANVNPDTGKSGVDALAREREQIAQRLDELRKRGVQAITKENGEWVASIDGRTIHVGDEIDGLKVTEITPSGIRVERKIEE